MSDNPVSPEQGTTTVTASAPGATVTQPTPDFSWKSHLNPDYANSPNFKKFPDTKDGLNEAVKSHLELERLLGNEKVPIPKGEDDKEGWARFSKAMGIPDKAEQYGLPDPEFPDTMKDIAFNKQEFAEVAHAFKLTPGQTKGLYNAYIEKFKGAYSKAMSTKEAEMTQVANQLRSEWGDAYETNIDLGQMVINKFSSDKDMQDFVTASILKHPAGAKFLAKIGNQFAENKIGEFGYKKFSLTPDQAQSEIDTIVKDPKHPYNDDKANPREREKAIDYVNSLYSVISKSRTS